MTLDQLRPYMTGIVTPVARLSIRLGLTPNTCTVLALVAAMVAGTAFWYREIGLGVLFVAVNAFFDAIDGAIARELGSAGVKGDFLDHVLDRYADIFIIIGIFAGGFASWEVGVFALTGVLMSSYLGTQAQAVGVGRYYGGLLGRADRLVLILLAGIADILFPSGLFSWTFLGIMLLLFGFLGHITAIQRFMFVWRELNRLE
ncbi:CDP-alcohol phosphatidyltransferase family protein [Methanocalculus taiwanensis]|uniref:CDP-alcohol phosphatidyltransferase family protein n=1 Tax=Methanocalculus taiwanensis TaxID=106207 RepID=A0ABD4TLT1_9EURY|nr:CDP-alcohol phosphatidyltransferase family protein [Methanocalculus taiwanensis]MCQ1538250.1 CDP-alcohol phosphatidyltransferase family protein [Methanocalculus taiwanensis]